MHRKQATALLDAALVTLGFGFRNTKADQGAVIPPARARRTQPAPAVPPWPSAYPSPASSAPGSNGLKAAVPWAQVPRTRSPRERAPTLYRAAAASDRCATQAHSDNE